MLVYLDKELVKIEPSISTFHELCILVVSWNCDSARPDSLTGDPRNANFLQEVLRSVDQQPDVIVFGFQEVIDLENRKMAAKNVILGGNSKKKPDDALSDKVTGAYKRWYDYLNGAVKSGVSPDTDYTAIHTDSLVGLFTCIFVKSELRNRFNDVLGNLIKRGMGGRYGNKVNKSFYYLFYSGLTIRVLGCHCCTLRYWRFIDLFCELPSCCGSECRSTEKRRRSWYFGRKGSFYTFRAAFCLCRWR